MGSVCLSVVIVVKSKSPVKTESNRFTVKISLERDSKRESGSYQTKAAMVQTTPDDITLFEILND